MLLLTLLTTAFGADLRVPATFAEGTGIVDLAFTGEDDRFVVFIEAATGQARVFDTATWDTQSFAPCAGAATAVGEGSTSGNRLFVGCDDGSLTWLTVEGDTVALSGASVAASSSQPVLGVVLVEGTLLAVAGNASGGSFEVFAEGSPEGLANGDTLVSGTTFSSTGFEDLAVSGQYAMLSQGSTFANRLTVTGGVQPNDSAAGVVDLGDALSTEGLGGSVQALFADPGSGSVVRFDQALLDLFAVLSEDDGLTEASALALLDEQLVVADSGAEVFSVFGYDSATGLPDRTVLDSADFPAGVFVNELVANDGYAVGSTRNGELWVLTERPWVELATADETTVAAGATLALTATADTAGSYRLLLNPTGDTGGTELASGSLSTDEMLDVSVTVEDTWGEGTNQVRLVVTDSSDGTVGHDAVLITVDSPPQAVRLSQRDLSFGDGALYLTIPALSESDLVSFEVYVSTTAFTEDAWNGCASPPCGGPVWDGDTALRTPVVVDATPGVPTEVALSPLENNTTHYLAVRAIDAGGLEGSMSNVVSGNPTETYSASELAGEAGGLSCASGGAGAAGLLGALAGLAAVGRRRRRGAAVLLAATGLGLASPIAEAHGPEADDPTDETVLPKVRFKPQGFGNLRLGSLQHEDQSIGQPYDTSMFLTLLEGGVRLSRFVEVGGGVGWSQEKGFLVSSSGAASGDETKLQVIPLTASGTFRLDVLREQFIVPYVSGGLDLWLWREVWDIDRAAGTSDRLSGSKNGSHTAIGVQILLDKLDKRRSSLIEARRGIADSYLTVEYRMQTVGESGDQSGLTFSGSMFNAGLSIAY